MYYNNGYYYACYNDYQYYLENGTWYWNMWQWSCKYDSAPSDQADMYDDLMSYYLYLYYDDDWYSWTFGDVYHNGGYLYYNDGYYYACYNGY